MSGNPYLYPVLVVVVSALVTMLTRFLPFWVFGTKRPVPEAVRYLGGILPPAIMATLVVYCLKSITPLTGNHGLPELIGVAVTALVHLWKRNTLLSIAGGTAVYMLLIHFIFV